MITSIRAVLERASVESPTADTLASLVAAPPSGSIAVAELHGASDDELALLAAVVAATDFRQFGAALQRLLEVVSAAQTTLSEYDNGRFWHLKGFAAWRLEDALYTATRALNRSLAFLLGVSTPHRHRSIWRASTIPSDSSYSIRACSSMPAASSNWP